MSFKNTNLCWSGLCGLSDCPDPPQSDSQRLYILRIFFRTHSRWGVVQTEEGQTDDELLIILCVVVFSFTFER
jgi:hypothetical protein